MGLNVSATMINEQQIVEALHRVPSARWGEVLEFIGMLEPASQQVPDIPSLAASTWTAADLQRWPPATQDAILQEQAARLLQIQRAQSDIAVGLTWWSAREIGKLPREQRGALLAASAALAEAEYRENADLTAFEAFGEDDLYVDSSDAQAR
jgi:hypothetical protein